ncbi:MAG TPA: hypothetical protein VE077_17660 [Candidatus Methylomirabilis sp.]|nr:hypothetical protein [Candidatus Methylomirabilis sp.]
MLQAATVQGQEHVEYIVAAFGILLAAIQSLGLFILSDIRKRITRLEDRAMGAKTA